MDTHTHRVVSPGRVNLIGDHTDYTGGFVLPVATDLHTRLEASPANEVTLYSEAANDRRSFAVDDQEANGDWTDYVKGCYTVLREEGYAPGGFDGELSATLPLGSGLSSSASLELAVVAFLNEIYSLGLSRERMAQISQRVENDFVGVSCGIMDQFAVALGQSGHALHIDTGSLAYDPIPIPDDVRLVVYHTGVERSLVETAYNERRETVEGALESLGVNSSTELGEEDVTDAGSLSELQRQRLGYVVRENKRVLRVADSLAGNDLETVGSILTAAHADIAVNYEASCQELDFVVDQAVDRGAYGARLTGAGWGGAAVALVDADDASVFARSLHERYRAQFPDYESNYYLVTPSDGVRVERQ
ncbi:MAG: galactokinase [Halobellus sp.]|uniref:galactokinase n=1 Tax=Halobellus sp. TaxID=1979212 RepID=UPI0035D40764